MIAPYATPPLTTLTMKGFNTNDNGNLTVSYTINGEDAPPFSIGIYQSLDGVQLGELIGTIDVSDPADLSGGGATHTLEYGGTLNGLDNGEYYLAQLDCYDQVQQTTRAGDTSGPLTGIFETSDGSLYALTGLDGGSHTLVFSQDGAGDVTATLDGVAATFQNVNMIYAVTYHGTNTIDASGVSVLSELYGGDGNDTINGGSSDTNVPYVMVGAFVPLASDSGGQAGEFQVTRVGDTTSALTVDFSLGGTVAETDYTITDGNGNPLDDSVTIPAGDTSAMIVVTPNPGVTGGDPTISLTLSSGTGYSVVSGDSGATLTVSDEDDSSDLPVVQLNCYGPDGSNGGSGGSTVMGDYIPMVVEASSSNPDGTTYTLVSDDPDDATVSLTPGGAPISSGTPIAANTTYYAFASAAAMSAGVDVSTDITANAWFAGSLLSSWTALVGFYPLLMNNNGIDITNGTPANPGCNVKVGQKMNLVVSDGATTSGLVIWTVPPGQTVKNYVPTVNGTPVSSCQPEYLRVADLFAAKVYNANIFPLSFAWVDGGNNRVETATLFSPFEIKPAKATATFSVEAPVANARVDMEDYANYPEQASAPNMNFYPLGTGQNGMNTFKATLNGANVAVAGFEGADAKDALHEMTWGAQFVATPTDLGVFTFSWVQVLTKDVVTINNNGHISYPTPNQNSLNGQELDNVFPYAPVPTNEFGTFDNPRWIITSPTVIIGLSVQYQFAATMWYMCTPNLGIGDGGVLPVPLAKIEWNMQFTVTGRNVPHKGPQWVTTGFHSPSAELDPTYDFPEWKSIFTNSAGANNFNFTQKYP